MLFGWLVSLSWLVAGTHLGLPAAYPFGIEPMYPGLLVSLAFWGLGRVRVARATAVEGK
jgi:hypothetical protein